MYLLNDIPHLETHIATVREAFKESRTNFHRFYHLTFLAMYASHMVLAADRLLDETRKKGGTTGAMLDDEEWLERLGHRAEALIANVGAKMEMVKLSDALGMRDEMRDAAEGHLEEIELVVAEAMEVANRYPAPTS